MFYLSLIELKEKKPTQKMAQDVFYDFMKLLINMTLRNLDLVDLNV